jgi:hypothetical protein
MTIEAKRQTFLRSFETFTPKEQELYLTMMFGFLVGLYHAQESRHGHYDDQDDIDHAAGDLLADRDM